MPQNAEMPVHAITMQEWQQLAPEDDEILAGIALSSDRRVRDMARQLTEQQILEIVELRSGLLIRSTSFVGRIRLGDLQITVQPKIRHDVLLSLFRYAYNLRDLRLLSQTEHGTLPEAFQDLLIQQLIAEVSELIARGLWRQYMPVDELLSTPRGRMDMQRLARQGGVREAAIPCTHHPRLEDRLVNQVVMAGLALAVQLTDDCQ